MKKAYKREGITLIALVVTIIVLIILASVSINLVLGENGIVTKAKTAKLEMRVAAIEEEKEMWFAEKQIEEVGTSSGETKTLEELLNELVNKKLITEKEKEEIQEDGVLTIGNKHIDFSGDEIYECDTYSLLHRGIDFEGMMLINQKSIDYYIPMIEVNLYRKKWGISDEEILGIMLYIMEIEPETGIEKLENLVCEGGIKQLYPTIEEQVKEMIRNWGDFSEEQFKVTMNSYKYTIGIYLLYNRYGENYEDYISIEYPDNVIAVTEDGPYIPFDMGEYICKAKIGEEQYKFRIKIKQQEIIEEDVGGCGGFEYGGTYKVDFVNKTYEKVEDED